MIFHPRARTRRTKSNLMSYCRESYYPFCTRICVGSLCMAAYSVPEEKRDFAQVIDEL